MVLPDAFQNLDQIHYYQGVIIAEVAVTLALYIILKIVHYVKWGADEEAAELENKEAAKGDANKKPEAQQDATTRVTHLLSQKWDQKIWDVYFPIIYTNHMASLILSLCYIPYIFQAIIAYVHFVCFCGLVIVNIFIKDAEEGSGNRTKASRILWLRNFLFNTVMCVLNIVQIIAGLTGVAKVLP